MFGCSPLWALTPTETVTGMTAAGVPRRLGLEVQFDAEPIRGRLYDDEPGGVLDQPFSGWIGLLAALDAARGRDDERGADE